MNIFTFRIGNNAATITTDGDTRKHVAGVVSSQSKNIVNISTSQICDDGNGGVFSLPFGSTLIPAGKKLVVKSVKAIVDGLPAARPGKDSLAFSGTVVASDGTTNKTTVALRLAEFEKQYPVQFTVHGTDNDWGMIYGSGSQFTIDDFDLTESWVGVEGNPTLEFTGILLDE